MSTWNYRVLRHKTEGDEDFLAIHEVFYRDGKWSCTVDPVPVGGASISDVRGVLDMMALALEKPILNLDDAGGETDPGPRTERAA